MATFKKNVTNSFALVKADMNNIKDWIFYLNEQIEVLKKENSSLKVKSSEEPEHIAAKRSKKVHTTKCPFAKNIKPENKIDFASLEHAFDQGFSGCQCVSA